MFNNDDNWTKNDFKDLDGGSDLDENSDKILKAVINWLFNLLKFGIKIWIVLTVLSALIICTTTDKNIDELSASDIMDYNNSTAQLRSFVSDARDSSEEIAEMQEELETTKAQLNDANNTIADLTLKLEAYEQAETTNAVTEDVAEDESSETEEASSEESANSDVKGENRESKYSDIACLSYGTAVCVGDNTFITEDASGDIVHIKLVPSDEELKYDASYGTQYYATGININDEKITYKISNILDENGKQIYVVVRHMLTDELMFKECY